MLRRTGNANAQFNIECDRISTGRLHSVCWCAFELGAKRTTPHDICNEDRWFVVQLAGVKKLPCAVLRLVAHFFIQLSLKRLVVDMIISTRTPEGEDAHCVVCGKDLRIEPSRPPGDATCPHCGTLTWFPVADSTPTCDCPATQQWLRAKAAFDAGDWIRARGLLSIALTLDPSNTQCKTALAKARSKLRDEKRRHRTAPADA